MFIFHKRIRVIWHQAIVTTPRANWMPLKYQPKEASILICDFSGFVPPEMVKKRPVVILRKHPHNSSLVTVVPLSTTAPTRVGAHHVELPCYIPGEAEICWAKCDMIYTLSIERLDRCKVRSRQGGREYKVFTMTPEHFDAVKTAVLAGLGLS